MKIIPFLVFVSVFMIAGCKHSDHPLPEFDMYSPTTFHSFDLKDIDAVIFVPFLQDFLPIKIRDAYKNDIALSTRDTQKEYFVIRDPEIIKQLYNAGKEIKFPSVPIDDTWLGRVSYQVYLDKNGKILTQPYTALWGNSIVFMNHMVADCGIIFENNPKYSSPFYLSDYIGCNDTYFKLVYDLMEKYAPHYIEELKANNEGTGSFENSLFKWDE